MPGIIRVVLPLQLQILAGTGREIEIAAEGPATLEAILSNLEIQYPMLKGTLRNQTTLERRPFIRFFAAGEDISLESPANLLPEAVIKGTEPLRVVGAMAGG